MKTNLIKQLLPTNQTDIEVKEIGKIIINALTAMEINNIKFAIQQRRSRNEDAETPSLDQRNAEDESTRGNDVKDLLTDDAGHKVELKPMQVAAILDGLRYAVYDELARVLGPETPLGEKVLFNQEPQEGPVNYNLPMSFEQMLDFKIGAMRKIDPKKIKEIAEEEDEPVEYVRQALEADANRLYNTWSSLKPDIMAEAASLDQSADYDDFVAVPLAVQKGLAIRVLGKLHTRDQWLLATKQRTPVLRIDNEEVPISTLRKFAKRQMAVCEQFLEDSLAVSR